MKTSKLLERVKSYADDYDIVPVEKEIYADIVTPIALLKKISAISKQYYLLESVEGGEKWGRYSFLGYDPLMRVSCFKNEVKILERDGSVDIVKTDNAMKVIRDLLKDYKSPYVEGLPRFTGGFVGYFSYAMIEHAEPTLNIKRGEFEDYDLMLFDKVIAYDQLKQKILVIENVSTKGSIEHNLNKALKSIDEVIEMINNKIAPVDRELFYPESKSDESKNKIKFKCNVTKEEYEAIVEKTKDYIRKGDIFQAVLSRQFVSDYDGSLINPYRVLRTTNPSPYMVYMNMEDVEIMSTSPETLVRLMDGRLTTFPVAGSRPRGKNEAEDKALEKELLTDEKELAEHNMLVDLGRNDLGRISKFSSVEVTEYMMVHKYSKIMHICSQVESNIKDDKDALDAISALLPAGTLSGAPKIRACEIIDELEKCPRGIYGGALGYIDFNGNMDTCIAIRMAVKKNGKVYVQAGGGIVADSRPESEYIESENKAKAVMLALENASRSD